MILLYSVEILAIGRGPFVGVLLSDLRRGERERSGLVSASVSDLWCYTYGRRKPSWPTTGRWRQDNSPPLVKTDWWHIVYIHLEFHPVAILAAALSVSVSV